MKSWEQRVGDVLSALRLDSIRNKILVLALLSTLVPALSTAALSYVRTRRALTEKLQDELQGIGSQSSRELGLWVKERSYDLRVFVGSFEVTENLDHIRRGGAGGSEALTRLTDYLTGVQELFGDYAELLVTDAGGRSVASSASALRDTDVPTEWLIALERGETMLGEPYLEASTGSVAATIAVPISSADARFLGVLLATLSFDGVQGILLDLVPGEGGRVDLISRDGRIIVASGPVSGFEPALDDETLRVLATAEGETTTYVDRAGTEMVGVLTAVERTEWSVIAHLPSAEAYAPISQLRNSTFALVSILLTVVGIIAYLTGLFIVRPLGRLAEGAGAVAAGDLSVDLPVTGRDEVGYLTEIFNGMVRQLREGREQLDAAAANLREQNAELERISMTDALTTLFNRRYLMHELEKEVHRASRHGRTLSVLMMDVDRFKQYNDTHGHLAGDAVLTGMGQVIRDATREPDIPARYGGEEFIVILPDCTVEGALDAAERIRKRLAEEVFDGGAVTVSIGVAQYPIHGEAPLELIAAADAAMYQAKNAGRDRVKAATVVPSGKAPDAPRGKAARRAKTASPKKTASAKQAVSAKKAASVKKAAAARNTASAKGAPAK